MRPDVILAFAFGTSDLVNWQIAQQVDLLAKEYSVPVIAQEEVATRMYVKAEVVIAPSQEVCLSTLHICRQFESGANQRHWNKVLVVAAPPHQKRCVRDLGMLGFGAQTETGALTEWFTYWQWWYDKTSHQRWTRGPLRWWLREIPLRLLPWWLYKLVAG